MLEGLGMIALEQRMGEHGEAIAQDRRRRQEAPVHGEREGNQRTQAQARAGVMEGAGSRIAMGAQILGPECSETHPLGHAHDMPIVLAMSTAGRGKTRNLDCLPLLSCPRSARSRGSGMTGELAAKPRD